jgi:hypothetical protein
VKLGLDALVEVAHAVLDGVENARELDAIEKAMLRMAASNRVSDVMQSKCPDLTEGKQTWLRACAEAWDAAEENLSVFADEGATASGGKA